MSTKKNGKRKTAGARVKEEVPARRKKKVAESASATAAAPTLPPAPKKEPALDYVAEVVDASALRPHPRNYKKHPPDQLDHIAASLLEHGYYKNIVVAKDGTILAGHGVWEAATTILGHRRIPVRRLNVPPDSAAALKILAADNELPLFAERDDRVLTEMLKEIREADPAGLLGTGYDEKMLAALLLNTRPASEIKSINEAAEWVGMPDYETGEIPIKLVITFKSEKDRKAFVDEQRMKIDKIAGLTWSTRWPWTEREDASSVRFTTGPVEPGTDANGRRDTPDGRRLSKKAAAAAASSAAER